MAIAMVVVVVVVVVDGSVGPGDSCYIWCYSGRVALVPSGSDPLRHVVAAKLSNCIK